jgi:hypothetical protein
VTVPAVVPIGETGDMVWGEGPREKLMEWRGGDSGLTFALLADHAGGVDFCVAVSVSCWRRAHYSCRRAQCSCWRTQCTCGFGADCADSAVEGIRIDRVL